MALKAGVLERMHVASHRKNAQPDAGVAVRITSVF
jgi:hypothetical protein